MYIFRVTKIVGGLETLQYEYPWQVGVTKKKSRRPFCGGSIISSTSILTAAHCTRYQRPGALEVVVGDHNWEVSDGETRYQVCDKVEHSQYDSGNNDHDLAILTLCSPIQWSPQIQPVCLPSSASDQVQSGTSAVVSGWGTTSSGGDQSRPLLAINVTTVDHVTCDQMYGGELITDNMFCAWDMGKDACQGDSGGPLIVQEQEEEDSHYTQVGVVSWGMGCADTRYPGVYANVAGDLQFIRDNMSGDTCSQP